MSIGTAIFIFAIALVLLINIGSVLNATYEDPKEDIRKVVHNFIITVLVIIVMILAWASGNANEPIINWDLPKAKAQS